MGHYMQAWSFRRSWRGCATRPNPSRARGGGRPPALPGARERAGAEAGAEPARRGDPGRGGGGAAARRLPRALAREDVEYISVKVSSVSSQLNLVAFRATIEVVKDRLRTLYRRGLRHLYTQPPTAAARRSSSTSIWRNTATSPSPWPRFARSSTKRNSSRSRAGSCCRPICPIPTAVLRDLADWAIAPGGAGRRAHQGPHRQGREPRHGAQSRPNSTAGTPRLTPPRRKSTRITGA